MQNFPFMPLTSDMGLSPTTPLIPIGLSQGSNLSLGGLKEMRGWDWLKVIILILLPINAWLAVHFYLYHQKQRALSLRESLKAELSEEARVRQIIHNWFGFKEGQLIRYPFHPSALVFGSHPPVGRGIPILFLNISTRADREIWDLAIKEALNASRYLHVALVHEIGFSKPSKIQELMKGFNNPRLCALVGERWVRQLFGQGFLEGEKAILLILCDGQGIIRAIVPYPERKEFKTWEEQVAYWRPKLHQAVKNALEKFYGKPLGTQGR